MKKSFLLLSFLCLFACVSCSSSDDEWDYTPNDLYAVIVPEGEQLISITPSDYVLTLDNIIAANSETGEFKLQNTDRIDSKAFPIPTQNIINFYSKGQLLFSAKLNSAISSYLPKGLTFCHLLSDKKGLARYDLEPTRFVQADGTVYEGDVTPQQSQGIQQMYQILKKAGKLKDKIEYDFRYE